MKRYAFAWLMLTVSIVTAAVIHKLFTIDIPFWQFVVSVLVANIYVEVIAASRKP